MHASGHGSLLVLKFDRVKRTCTHLISVTATPTNCSKSAMDREEEAKKSQGENHLGWSIPNFGFSVVSGGSIRNWKRCSTSTTNEQSPQVWWLTDCSDFILCLVWSDLIFFSSPVLSSRKGVKSISSWHHRSKKNNYALLDWYLFSFVFIYLEIKILKKTL